MIEILFAKKQPNKIECSNVKKDSLDKLLELFENIGEDNLPNYGIAFNNVNIDSRNNLFLTCNVYRHSGVYSFDDGGSRHLFIRYLNEKLPPFNFECVDYKNDFALSVMYKFKSKFNPKLLDKYVSEIEEKHKSDELKNIAFQVEYTNDTEENVDIELLDISNRDLDSLNFPKGLLMHEGKDGCEKDFKYYKSFCKAINSYNEVIFTFPELIKGVESIITEEMEINTGMMCCRPFYKNKDGLIQIDRNICVNRYSRFKIRVAPKSTIYLPIHFRSNNYFK